MPSFGLFFYVFVILIFFVSYNLGSNSSYYNKIATLNFDKRYILGIMSEDYAERETNIIKNETIRECTCSEYDNCVDIAFDPIRNSQCENSCLKTMNEPGLNFDKYLQTLKANKSHTYIVHNCFKINDNSYCAQNSSTFIPKTNDFFSFEAKLVMFLLKNNIKINNSTKISHEEWQYHECVGECLLEHVKRCFKTKECDIALPDYGVYGCMMTNTSTIQHGFHPPPSFINGRIRSLEDVPLIPNKNFWDMVNNYSKNEKERLTRKFIEK